LLQLLLQQVVLLQQLVLVLQQMPKYTQCWAPLRNSSPLL
jgi:hypothetical protein